MKRDNLRTCSTIVMYKLHLYFIILDTGADDSITCTYAAGKRPDFPL